MFRTVSLSIIRSFFTVHTVMVYVLTACEQDQDRHVLDSSSVNHPEFFTVHTAMVYAIQVTVTACEQDQDGTPS